MRNVECEKEGHLYDADIYDSCPYCKRNNEEIFFGSDPETVPIYPSGNGGMSGKRVIKNMMGGSYSNGGILDNIGKPEAAEIDPYGIRPTEPPREYVFGKDSTPAGSLWEGGKNRRETIAADSVPGGGELIVGWIVCIEGEYIGKDFRLFGRINRIGTGENADVDLGEDKYVSENTASLAYDPRHNKFTLIPADSNKNNIYLNDNPVYQPMAISSYDCIEFGKGKYIFVPFCGEQFTWETKPFKLINGRGTQERKATVV